MFGKTTRTMLAKRPVALLMLVFACLLLAIYGLAAIL
jgi:hypothetical protein